MQLSDFGKRTTSKRIGQLLKENFNIDVPVDKLTVPLAQKYKNSAQLKIHEFKMSEGFYSSEKNPAYLGMVMLNSLLGEFIRENKSKKGRNIKESRKILEYSLQKKKFEPLFRAACSKIGFSCSNNDIQNAIDDNINPANLQAVKAFMNSAGGVEDTAKNKRLEKQRPKAPTGKKRDSMFGENRTTKKRVIKEGPFTKIANALAGGHGIDRPYDMLGQNRNACAKCGCELRYDCDAGEFGHANFADEAHCSTPTLKFSHNKKASMKPSRSRQTESKKSSKRLIKEAGIADTIGSVISTVGKAFGQRQLDPTEIELPNNRVVQIEDPRVQKAIGSLMRVTDPTLTKALKKFFATSAIVAMGAKDSPMNAAAQRKQPAAGQAAGNAPNQKPKMTASQFKAAGGNAAKTPGVGVDDGTFEDLVGMLRGQGYSRGDAVKMADGAIVDNPGVTDINTLIRAALPNPQQRETQTESIIMKRARKMILEGEMENAEAALAAKDLVDRIQDMVEELGKMSNEELPHLTDAIRMSFGADAATAYNASANEQLTALLTTVKSCKDQLNNATLVLTGDADGGTDLGLEGDTAGDLDQIGGLGDESDIDDLDIDAENEAEPAPLGRAEREAVKAVESRLRNSYRKINETRKPTRRR